MLVSQAGVDGVVEQSLSPMHGSHVPARGRPGGTHTPDWHCEVDVQGSPGAMPHSLLLGSQTPLTQAFGSGSGQPPGAGPPFGTCGSQLELPSAKLHQSPIGQSVSCWQVALHDPFCRLQ